MRRPSRARRGTGTVERHGPGWRWRATITGPDGARQRPQRGGYPTREAAEAALRIALAELDQRTRTHDATTVAELADAWTAAHDRTWKTATLRRHSDNLRGWVVPQLGRTRLDRVDTVAVTRLYRAAAAAMTPAGVANLHRTTRAMFGWAVKIGRLPRNPAVHAPRPRLERVERRALTAADVAAVLAHCTPRWRSLFAFLFDAGCRPGEACALAWADVDLDRRLVRIRSAVAKSADGWAVDTTKTGRARTVNLSEPAIARLRQWRELSPGRWAWPADSDPDRPVTPEVAGHAWARAARAAGVDGRLYDLRHAHASLLLANLPDGVSIADVAQRLGHSPGVLLATYAHAADAGSARLGDAANWL